MMRPWNMRAKALRAGFQRMAHRCLGGRVEGPQREVEALERGLVGGEVPAGPDCSSEPGVERLDGVGAEDHLADFDLEREEGHELGPGVLPEPHDPRVALSPGGAELDEAFLGRGFGGEV
jgi:hypothetical protein